MVKTLSGAAIPYQSEPGSNGNERVLQIPQSSDTEASLSDCFVSYPGDLLWGCLTLLQRCSQCILQPQTTGLSINIAFRNTKNSINSYTKRIKS